MQRTIKRGSCESNGIGEKPRFGRSADSLAELDKISFKALLEE